MMDLQFSGGHDEGHLDINLTPAPKYPHSRVWNKETGKYEEVDVGTEVKEAWAKHSEFITEVENWAWETFNYGGAGEGVGYGDNVIYNIEEGTVTHSEWGYIYQQENHPEERITFVKKEES